jgi:hypothetical protein
MVSEAMHEVMQQVLSFTLDEKLRLMAFLADQARLDASKPDGESLVNGDSQETGVEAKKIPNDVPDRYFRREYEWLRQHRHEYAGQYVAIEGDKLYAHGPEGRKTLAEARQAGAKHPLIVRVEAEDELPFGGW